MAESRAVVRHSGVSGWSGYGYVPSLTSSRLERGCVKLGETGERVVDVADLDLVAAQGDEVCEAVGKCVGRGVRARGN
jgi:hypothetical protein